MTAIEVAPSSPPAGRPSKLFMDPPGRTQQQATAGTAAQATPTHVMKQELEQLRQRGLTKSLFNHFTKECRKVSLELDAAEAALTELEVRRKKASEFAPTSPEIKQLDMMCSKVAEWKKQCRKNENETVMLYGRYCEKFGNSIELAKPEDLLVKSSESEAKTSLLATTDIATLLDLFEKAEEEPHGIPTILLPKEAAAPSSFCNKELEEILEDSSLQDVETAPRALPATPKTASDVDLDDSSIVSGLTTLNSAVTREVLHDVENRVMDFIKKETDNIRRMMEKASAAPPAGNESNSITTGSRRSSSQAESVAEHEKMVTKMQQVLEAFKRAEEEAKVKEDETTTPQTRRLDVDGVVWYEKFDEIYQKHYYVEAKTNRTQWNMPQPAHKSGNNRSDLSVADENSLSISMNTLSASMNTLSTSMNTAGTLPTRGAAYQDMSLVQDFIPEPRTGRGRKRLELYRAKVRKQRNRQFVVMGIVLAVLGAGAIYYKYTSPDKLENAMETVANVIGLDGSGSSSSSSSSSASVVEEVQVKRRRNASQQQKKTKTETKAKTENTKKKETLTSSSTPSIPVSPSATKKAVPPTTTTSSSPTKPTKQEVPPPTQTQKEAAAPIKKTAVVSGTDTGGSTSNEDMGLATFKPETQHWILDVLIGPLAFKDVNRKCLNPEIYCGFHPF